MLEEGNDSEWGAPSFAQPKEKMNQVRFLSDFQNLNRQLKGKPHPIPKISEMLLNFEGFQYATSLDLKWVIITYVLSKRQVIYVLLSYHGESISINAYQWVSITPRTFSKQK